MKIHAAPRRSCVDGSRPCLLFGQLHDRKRRIRLLPTPHPRPFGTRLAPAVPSIHRASLLSLPFQSLIQQIPVPQRGPVFVGLARATVTALLAGSGSGNGTPAVVAAGIARGAVRARVGVRVRVREASGRFRKNGRSAEDGLPKEEAVVAALEDFDDLCAEKLIKVRTREFEITGLYPLPGKMSK